MDEVDHGESVSLLDRIGDTLVYTGVDHASSSVLACQLVALSPDRKRVGSVHVVGVIDQGIDPLSLAETLDGCHPGRCVYLPGDRLAIESLVGSNSDGDVGPLVDPQTALVVIEATSNIDPTVETVIEQAMRTNTHVYEAAPSATRCRPITAQICYLYRAVDTNREPAALLQSELSGFVGAADLFVSVSSTDTQAVEPVAASDRVIPPVESHDASTEHDDVQPTSPKVIRTHIENLSPQPPRFSTAARTQYTAYRTSITGPSVDRTQSMDHEKSLSSKTMSILELSVRDAIKPLSIAIARAADRETVTVEHLHMAIDRIQTTRSFCSIDISEHDYWLDHTSIANERGIDPKRAVQHAIRSYDPGTETAPIEEIYNACLRGGYRREQVDRGIRQLGQRGGVYRSGENEYTLT
ncbi:MAG: hypothetical protein ACQETB_11015 [Halobacteriota archaeon]